MAVTSASKTLAFPQIGNRNSSEGNAKVSKERTLMHGFALALPRNLLLAAGIAAILSVASASARADDDPPAQAGRLGSITGTVSIQQAGNDDWNQAYENFSLGPGDRVYTDRDGRAEIQVGRTYLRIGPNTDVTFVDLDDANLEFGIAQGSVHLHCMGLWPGQSLYINTPSGNATINHDGEIRVDVFPDQGATVFTDLGSFVHLNGAGNYQQNLDGGQAMELAGTNPVYGQWLEPAPQDDLDRWSNWRDRWLNHATSYRYVSPEIPGAEELDNYGTWRTDTEYGAVWYPQNLPAGWSPYHFGHWVNRPPWGWVWAEDEPWGYAPFHYGRWVNDEGRWGWVPGPRDAHPIWSPALVAFAGGVNIGGFGISAWFPLGPGEGYRPWYHASPRYIDRVNISNMQESRRVHVQNTYVNIVNVTNVTNITYVNRTTGVTAMRHEDFAAGRPAQQAAVRVDAHQFDHMRVLDRPEPKPMERPFAGPPPARPVPVQVQRPVLVNAQGRTILAQPGKQPDQIPVRPVAPVQPRPGAAIAPPPGFHVGAPQGGARPFNPGANPAAQPGGNQPAVNPNQRPMNPSGNQTPQPPSSPVAQPKGTVPAFNPNARQATPGGAQSYTPPKGGEPERQNLNPGNNPSGQAAPKAPETMNQNVHDNGRSPAPRPAAPVVQPTPRPAAQPTPPAPKPAPAVAPPTPAARPAPTPVPPAPAAKPATAPPPSKQNDKKDDKHKQPHD